jgi:hypothetical protein
MDRFTVEETNLISIFNQGNRSGLIIDLLERTPDFDDDMLDLALHVMVKLDLMSDAEFAALELCPEYGNITGNNNEERKV